MFINLHDYYDNILCVSLNTVYSQRSHCGYPAITDTLIVQTVAKSLPKKLQTFDWNKLPLLRTLTKGDTTLRCLPLPKYSILEVYILCNQSILQKVYKKYTFCRNQISVEYTWSILVSVLQVYSKYTTIHLKLEHPKVYFKYTLNMLIGVLENQLAARLYEKYTFICLATWSKFYLIRGLIYILTACLRCTFSFFLYDPLSPSNIIIFITSKILHEPHMLETCHIF